MARFPVAVEVLALYDVDLAMSSFTPPIQTHPPSGRAADEAAVSNGLNLEMRDGRQLAAFIRLFYDHVLQSISEKSITPMMEYLYAHHTKSLRSVANVPIACKSGCSHCCHCWVSATTPEILWVIKTLPPEQRARVTERVAAANALTEGKTHTERSTMLHPCPMLEDHACSVYPNRPAMCRSVVSTDASVCERSCLQFSGEEVPSPMVYFALTDAYNFALAIALNKAGLQHHGFEYNAALKVVLNTPGAELEWLAGKNVFPSVIREDDLLADRGVRAVYRLAFG